MIIVNILLAIILIFSLLLTFFTSVSIPNSTDLIIQLVAVGVGVIAGMQADKYLDKISYIHYLVNALRIIKKELQSNVTGINTVCEFINKRPSITEENINSFSPSRLYSMALDEFEYFCKFANLLEDRSYYSFLSNLPRMDDSELLEAIAVSYTKLAKVKLVFGISEDKDDLTSYTDDQLKFLHSQLNDTFTQRSDAFNKLKTDLESTIKKIQTYIEYIDNLQVKNLSTAS